MFRHDMDIFGVFIFLSALLTLATTQNVYVVSPNVIRLGVETRIVIAVDGINDKQRTEVFLQDHPGRRKNLTHTLVTIEPGIPKIVTIQVKASDVPDFIFNDPSVRNFVSLTVHNPTFHKTVILPITHKTGYVYIQTDKPIYTPNEIVNFRIIPTNEDDEPPIEKIKFQIKNPKNIAVLEKELDGQTFITPEPYKFPSYPLFGVWSANVLYGHQFLQNTTIQFELQKYVLPTFIVKLTTQEVILPSDEDIQGTVEAKYVYGKPVEGSVTLKLGIKSEAPEAKMFTVVQPEKLNDGMYTYSISSDKLKNLKNVGWFPEIQGSRFVVEATVTDAATGQTEVALDTKGYFTTSPFVISFKHCPNVFKPGLISVIQADINYVDGKPASYIRTSLTALADGAPLRVINNVSLSDENGKIRFEVHPETVHKEITITVQTDDPRYEGSQSVGHHLQHSFKSDTTAYLAITRNSKELPEPGKMFSELIYFKPETMTDIYFLVISKGKIHIVEKLPHGKYELQNIEFLVTYDMVPSFRIVAFTHHKNELIADSIQVDVAKKCDPSAEINLKLDFNNEPGSNGKIKIEGTKSTLVGLLAVDSAVYALSKKGLLTKAKMFQVMESHNLGCGPGDGVTTNSVLRNAGVVMATNHYTPSADATVTACEEKVRKKRNILDTKVNEFEGRLRECCALGMSHDKYSRTCDDRASIVEKHLGEDDNNCSEVFLKCCLHGKEHGVTGMKLKNKGSQLNFQVARMGNVGNDLEFISIDMEEDLESGARVRTDFRETWIFEDKTIGPDGKQEIPFSLPHSITTWVIQAVSVSQTSRMCVAEPQNLLAFKTIFLQLNLPYSVVKNEQIEVRATVFNYGDKNLRCIVYMYGVEDLCTGFEAGQKSERKRIEVPPNSARTVSFPVIPLAIGVYDIKVIALAAVGSDIVIRKLNVVPEGETIEREISLVLDPSNQQRRSKRHVTTDLYADSIDDSQNLQLTSIPLKLPDDFISGTESCVISCTGDQFGPTVQTSLENPDTLLDKPRGCAEQAMIYLAPTMYTMKYLKAVNKIDSDTEAKGYDLIRQGYDLILTYRKDDGSYGAWINTPSSTWLTAFIIKVFCQASKLVYINEEVMCSGVKWLVTKQSEDGSFIEHHPIYHTEMMGGVQGQAPLTAFVLLTLQECSCEIPNLHIIKARAMSYLEDHLGDISEPLPVAIAAYALALTGSELTQAINSKLMTLSEYDEGRNMLHWPTGSSSYDVEATSYALLTQLLLPKMDTSNSIINWLNTQRMSTGSFKSTQDTVVALHALSEYAMQVKKPALNLISNITSSNDRNLHKSFKFSERDTMILQEYKVDKLGGLLLVNTRGHGVGYLSVKLRYNIPKPIDKLCKFDVVVNVTEEKEKPQVADDDEDVNEDFELYQYDLIRGVKGALDVPPQPIELAINPRNRQRVAKLSRSKREDKLNNSNQVLRVNICAKYLGHMDTGMSIIDAGIFSGFNANEEDLKQLVQNPESEVERYDLSSRGVVFYLRRVSREEPNCISFRIIKDYNVGKTQSSIIKVYAYYNPDDACSVFYSPNRDSPLLRKICDKKSAVCQCAEGGCPPEKPFDNIDKKTDLKKIACEEHDYVWIVNVLEEVGKQDGFIKMKVRVIEVLKEGSEEESLVKNEVRIFLARDDCESAELSPNKKYFIMGKDGRKNMNDQGEIEYEYFLGKTSKINVWEDNPPRQGILRRLHRLRSKLKDGCDL